LVEAQPRAEPADDYDLPKPEKFFAPARPALAPRMLLSRRTGLKTVFPFSDPSVRHYYFARNGIFALAQQWRLEGQEILFPSYFHGVELDALLAAGVRPRFYPVGADMRVEPDDIISRIRAQTRAVYLIHYLGFPGPVEELAAVCRERNLPLIEDCALALLSRQGQRPLGSFGDAAIFCLYKTLPVPNGGALVMRTGRSAELPPTDRASLPATMSNLASSLRTHFEMEGHKLGELLLTALQAAGKKVVKASQLERVEVGSQEFDLSSVRLGMSYWSQRVLASQDYALIVERRRRNYLHLLHRLEPLSRPLFADLLPGVCPLFYPLRVRSKLIVLDQLLANGVEAVNFWLQGHPATPCGTFREADRLRLSILELPCHQDLSPETMDRIADIVWSCRNWV
jgi:perosamine synthetase